MPIEGHDHQLLTQPLTQLGDEHRRSDAAMSPEREVGNVTASLARDSVQVARAGAEGHLQFPIAIYITKGDSLQPGSNRLSQAVSVHLSGIGNSQPLSHNVSVNTVNKKGLGGSNRCHNDSELHCIAFSRQSQLIINAGPSGFHELKHSTQLQEFKGFYTCMFSQPIADAPDV